MNRIRKLINEEMPNWQHPNEGTFEWDIDDVERFTSIIAVRAVRECCDVAMDHLDSECVACDIAGHFGFSYVSE